MIVFKTVQILIIIIFAISVSDLRNKNVTIRLLNPSILLSIKISYLIPLVIFLYSVITVHEICKTDYIGLFITFIGLLIVIIAKSCLGKNHTWTGYGTYPNIFCTTGIYSLIRHPMYTGIITCILGMIVHVSQHVAFPLLIINIFSSLFIIYVLISSGQKETDHLVKLFGLDYKTYVDQVHPFLPIRKYKQV